jgi:hypothetical protein
LRKLSLVLSFWLSEESEEEEDGDDGNREDREELSSREASWL